MLIRQVDATAPAVVAPQGVTSDAVGPAGAAVEYGVAATDNFDRAPVLSCSHASGSLFPIGTTTVSCIATDSQGNSATASFDVVIRGADEQLATLEDAVAAAAEFGNRNRRFVQFALLSRLRSDPVACDSLGSFVAAVDAATEPSWPITPAHATAWQTAAVQIATVIGCGPLVQPTPDDARRPPQPLPAVATSPPAPRVRPPHTS